MILHIINRIILAVSMVSFFVSCSNEFALLLDRGQGVVKEVYTINQPADRVLGSGFFNDGTGGTSILLLTGPTSVLVAGGRLYVADSGNYRILGYNQVPTGSGTPADFVMGQGDYNTGDSQAVSASTMGPVGLTSDGTRLFVADYYNHRVLIFNTLPSSSNPEADIVVGQSGMNSAGGVTDQKGMLWPIDISVAQGKMVVSDHGNNRVLVYNSIPSANWAPADLVLGQGDFTHGTQNDDNQNGTDDGSPTSRTLRTPGGIWTDGTRIIVADAGNLRVLIWNSWPTSNFQPADVVLGKADFNTNISGATSASEMFLNFFSDVYVSASGKLYVSDVMHQRVLIFDSIPAVNGWPADSVIGQSDFSGFTGGTSAVDFSRPSGLFVDSSTGTLYVTDELNDRVLMYDTQ